MKKLCRFLSITLSFFVLVGVFSISTSADDLITDSDVAVYYDETNRKILDKIDELGQLKSKASAIKEYYELNEHPDVKLDLYEKILAEIGYVRNELVALGAEPSNEMLASIKFDSPIMVQGVLIDDFADFEYTFGDAYDLWGVSQTVNASYGTFYTYEIIIQDYPNQDILSTSITQNGAAGYDIYAQSSSVLGVVTGYLGNISFNKILGSIYENIPVFSTIYDGLQILQSLQSVASDITANDAVTVNGLSQSYRIHCIATSTVHFIYVRDTVTSPWQHSFTTNSVHLNETHIWAMNFAIGNGQTRCIPGNKDYSTTVYPNRWAYRLTNAITAYRNNKSRYYDIIEEYTIDVENNGVTREAFSISVTCPLTYDDLIRYGVQ